MSDTGSDTETTEIEENSESLSELTQAEWIEQYGPKTATYEDETLVTQYGAFAFKESDYAESLDGSPVVIVRFDYTNTTDEKQGIEFLIWDYFDGKQIFEDTTETTGYLIMDGDEPYYDEYHNTQVEINPRASVPGAYGITLKDNSVPMTLDFKDENGDIIGTKEFVLK